MWMGYLRTRRKKGRSWSFQCISMRISRIAAMWHSSWETWAKDHFLSDMQPTKSKVMLLPRSNLVNQCIYGVTYVTLGEGLLMWTGRLKDNCVSKSPPKKKKMEPFFLCIPWRQLLDQKVSFRLLHLLASSVDITAYGTVERKEPCSTEMVFIFYFMNLKESPVKTFWILESSSLG